jgi:hypothetical protein
VLRRISSISLLVCLAWPALAVAAPKVQEIVDKAIQAVHSQCYEARMRFLSQMDGGTEQTVHIYHLAPDLYRVIPLTNGADGDLAFVENAEELVRIRPSKSIVEQMPQRQFSLNDSLTVTFLRMLSTRPGTTVLNGKVASCKVYVLRQDGSRHAPYTITVGVDQTTFYPVFLSVGDTKGRKHVYYEMEAIEYVQRHQLRDELFIIPKSTTQQRMNAPRVSPTAPKAQKGASTVDNDPQTKDLPLYPQWLPTGYRIEAISVLNYVPNGAAEPVLVFQCEAYGPDNDLISIFQTRSDKVNLKVSDSSNDSGRGYAMRERNGWVVTVIGKPGLDKLLRIADELDANDQRVLQLLRQTSERDRILQQFASE